MTNVLLGKFICRINETYVNLTRLQSSKLITLVHVHKIFKYINECMPNFTNSIYTKTTRKLNYEFYKNLRIVSTMKPKLQDYLLDLFACVQRICN